MDTADLNYGCMGIARLQPSKRYRCQRVGLRYLAFAAALAFWLPQAERCGAVELCGKSSLTNSIGMKLARIPPGEFLMGTTESPESLAKEFGYPTVVEIVALRPQHRVRITRPFYIGAYEVTVGQFGQFVKETGYRTEAEQPGADHNLGFDLVKGDDAYGPEYNWRNPGFPQTKNHPVVNMTWDDAIEFCRWLSRKEGKDYFLPTEAQWEYAARGGTTTRFWTGNDPAGLATAENVADKTLGEKYPRLKASAPWSDGHALTAPVGTFRPNPFGLYDMLGNVAEWCADHCDFDGGNYYEVSPVDDPTGPANGTGRAARGGSWRFRGGCACAERGGGADPHTRSTDLGFRVALRDPAGPQSGEK